VKPHGTQFRRRVRADFFGRDSVANAHARGNVEFSRAEIIQDTPAVSTTFSWDSWVSQVLNGEVPLWAGFSALSFEPKNSQFEF